MSAPVTTQTGPAPPAPAALGPVELARWAWRQLTSMRTALLLLFLLALASVPGSVVPQENVDSVGVARWKDAHPSLTPVYERLQLFSVYDSVWFSAIYILLAVSLVGCVVPRLRVYWRALRARPPAAPRHLGRLPAYRRVEARVGDGPDVVLAEAERALSRDRFRTVRDDGAGWVAAERGYLREAGNLVFHVAVLVALAGFAMGQVLGYKGGAIVMVGQGFSNSLSQYDDFAPGSLFDVANLAPLSFRVDDFDVTYLTSGPEMGQPSDFSAPLTYVERPGAPERHFDLEVNHPLTLDGVSVFLVGNGYAPVVTVRDGNGDLAYRGPVVFLPQDASFRSFGVLKVPDARPQQLGFEGEFYPTYGFTPQTGPFSQFPDALAPKVSLLAYAGDLGLDDGRPQNVYDLDKDELDVVQRPGAAADDPRGTDLRITLAPGERTVLPDGLGSIRLDGWQRWVKLQVSHSPGKPLALGGVLLGLVGLMGSLFVRPRRMWVRASVRDGRTVVEVAGLDRSTAGEGLDRAVDELAARLAAPHEDEERSSRTDAAPGVPR